MAEGVAYTTYKPELVPAIVAFWNRVFAEKRNFYPIYDQIFLKRVAEKKTAVETFNPLGFIIARKGEEIVGIVHAGRHSEVVCRTLNPDWPGGQQGYIALIAVDPEHRRQGIGKELWDRARAHLDDTGHVVLDGQCLNPFYGNSEGPFTPFWGTPEGISVEWNDKEARRFFSRRGHEPRYRGVQMELKIAEARVQQMDRLEADIRARGVDYRVIRNEYPEAGKKLGESSRKANLTPFECLAAIDDKHVAAVLCVYPMMELGPARHAIYEAVVDEKYRQRGLGRGLLGMAIERMRAQGAESCDVLTIPDVSEAAFKLYESVGFKPVAEWAIY